MLSVRPKAVAFDAYGTLVSIGQKRRPFAALSALAQIPLEPSPLVKPIGLLDAYRNSGARLSEDVLTALEEDLAVELASIQPYPEAASVLTAVKDAGLLTAVASNLALPYVLPVSQAFEHLLDVCCFSFEVGAVKPEGAFYEVLCRRLNLDPSQVLMIGDTWRCDYAGARSAGLMAFHLDRRGNATGDQVAVSVGSLSELLPRLGLV